VRQFFFAQLGECRETTEFTRKHVKNGMQSETASHIFYDSR